MRARDEVPIHLYFMRAAPRRVEKGLLEDVSGVATDGCALEGSCGLFVAAPFSLLDNGSEDLLDASCYLRRATHKHLAIC